MKKLLLFITLILIGLTQATFVLSNSTYKELRIEKTIKSNDVQDKVGNDSTKEIIKEQIIIDKEQKGFWYAPFSTWLQVLGSLAAVATVIYTLIKSRSDKKYNKEVIDKMSAQVEALIKSNNIREKQFLALIKPHFVQTYKSMPYDDLPPLLYNGETKVERKTFRFQNIGEKALNIVSEITTEKSYLDINGLYSNCINQKLVNKEDMLEIIINREIKETHIADDSFELDCEIIYSDINDNLYKQKLKLNSSGISQISNPTLIIK